MSGINNDLSIRSDIKVYDANGYEIVSNSLTKSYDNARAVVEVNVTKEVPIEYQVSGVLEEGFLATGVVEGDPKTVILAGRNSVLSAINQIIVPAEKINITGATTDYITYVNLKDLLPDGVTFADESFNGRAMVTVFIEEEVEKRLNVRIGNITLDNIPEGFVAQIAEDAINPILLIKGLEAEIEMVNEYTLHGVVDVSTSLEEYNVTTIRPGRYVLPVSFPSLEEERIVTGVTIPIILTAQEVDTN